MPGFGRSLRDQGLILDSGMGLAAKERKARKSKDL